MFNWLLNISPWIPTGILDWTYSKTKLLIFFPKRAFLLSFPISANGILPETQAKNWDSSLTLFLTPHAQSVRKYSWLCFQDLFSIWPLLIICFYLTGPNLHLLLNDCNGLLLWSACLYLHPLQSVLNMATRVTLLNTSESDHVTFELETLQWLPCHSQ